MLASMWRSVPFPVAGDAESWAQWAQETIVDAKHRQVFCWMQHSGRVCSKRLPTFSGSCQEHG